MQKKDNMTVITVNLTSNGHGPNGDTADIIIDRSQKHLFTDRTLCVASPKGSLFIKRDYNGNVLKRIGNKADGVSLVGYIHGKTHMQRNNVDDVEDYRAEAFKPDTGKPKAIGVYTSPTASKPISIMFEDEESIHLQSPSGKTKQAKHYQTTIRKLEKLRQQAKDAPNGDVIHCPHCEELFRKTHSVMAFCSSTDRPGRGNKKCKDVFNNKLTGLRQKLAPISIKKPQLELSLKETTKQPDVTTEMVAPSTVVSRPSKPTPTTETIQVTEPDGRTIAIPVNTPPDVIKLLLTR